MFPVPTKLFKLGAGTTVESHVMEFHVESEAPVEFSVVPQLLPPKNHEPLTDAVPAEPLFESVVAVVGTARVATTWVSTPSSGLNCPNVPYEICVFVTEPEFCEASIPLDSDWDSRAS